jgi:hypothetical protein
VLACQRLIGVSGREYKVDTGPDARRFGSPLNTIHPPGSTISVNSTSIFSDYVAFALPRRRCASKDAIIEIGQGFDDSGKHLGFVLDGEHRFPPPLHAS